MYFCTRSISFIYTREEIRHGKINTGESAGHKAADYAEGWQKHCRNEHRQQLKRHDKYDEDGNHKEEPQLRRKALACGNEPDDKRYEYAQYPAYQLGSAQVSG